MQFQTNSLTVDNATIVGLSLIPAAAPAPPPSPVVPIDYSNTSVQVPEPLPLVNLSVVLDSETGSVTYSIPRDINIVVQPPTVVSVYPSVCVCVCVCVCVGVCVGVCVCVGAGV